MPVDENGYKYHGVNSSGGKNYDRLVWGQDTPTEKGFADDNMYERGSSTDLFRTHLAQVHAAELAAAQQRFNQAGRQANAVGGALTSQAAREFGASTRGLEGRQALQTAVGNYTGAASQTAQLGSQARLAAAGSSMEVAARRAAYESEVAEDYLTRLASKYGLSYEKQQRLADAEQRRQARESRLLGSMMGAGAAGMAGMADFAKGLDGGGGQGGNNPPPYSESDDYLNSDRFIKHRVRKY